MTHAKWAWICYISSANVSRIQERGKGYEYEITV